LCRVDDIPANDGDNDGNLDDQKDLNMNQMQLLCIKKDRFGEFMELPKDTSPLTKMTIMMERLQITHVLHSSHGRYFVL